MIRIAILEHEAETKDIVFALSHLLQDQDWLFRHYWKASQLAKEMKQERFQIFIFDEMFRTPRLESVFVHDNPDALFLYVGGQEPVQDSSRIFTLPREGIADHLQQVMPSVQALARQTETYSLMYDGVHVNLPYQDILYLEKMDKMVYFHTRKGVFHKRMNMSELEEIFSPYGFVRVHVSYLVNRKHILSWQKEEVELVNHEKIPVSRSAKRRLKENWQPSQ